ncbi:two-component sensor histidine kinase [Streptomyces sp. WAC 06738]|uniref:sensor histidine kinase n=1 Tax=Streptomyces sp. WAC 06738 TaxID=2203210 RepID=UPI000F6EBEB6|nr:histidine kinase [Streptomyces sp. WAC 06738]AZM45338.1 two-component sensor histidine kinase [Streptomyces sp. WAC 06738]
MTAAAQTDANSEHTVLRYLATAIEDGRETGRDARAYAKDAGFAAAVALGCVGTMLLAPDGRTGFDALAWALGLIGSVALVARHRFPRAVLVIAAAAMVAYQLRGYPDGSPVLPMLVAVYRSIRGGHRGFFAVTALLSLVVSLGSLPLLPLGDEALRAALEKRFLTFGWVVACAMGAAMRIQHEAMLAQAEERAAENAQRSADEERLRIARELHDTLTHSISVIKVQAGVAVHLSKKRGEEPPPALLAIQEASGDAARELRSTLHVLRNADGGAEGVGLERLPELVERARGSGVPATVAVAGERPVLPAEVDRAAYRIVQESLTNVARHAGPAAAVGVHVSYAPDKVVVQVDDDGAADPGAPPRPGIGLTGMRERVTALGGELHAAPRPEGGFRVRAELPLPRAGGPAGAAT